HGSCVLPGEDVAADRYQRLLQAEAALREGDVASLRAAAARRGEQRVPTASLQRAIDAMDGLLDEVSSPSERPTDPRIEDWIRRAAGARSAVVRSSIELRALAVRLPWSRGH
ncbi:MAG: hypothetical protein ACO1PW_04570, partial [Actinomycetota bacterium]